MERRFYSGKGKQRAAGVQGLPKWDRKRQLDPARYLADPGLADAVEVAITLQQPLLLTGEPGTGKTQLAYSLAWELGLVEPLKFETRSSSIARDLFYIYDAIGRFQAGQAEGATSVDARNYLYFGALGRAILRAGEDPDGWNLLQEDLERSRESKERIEALTSDLPQRSVVLVDEIDKAPRDFPNDILNELEHTYFRVPELANRLYEASPERRPLIVITSNSEKDLPDAFLRRCVFYNVPFPERKHSERMREIVEMRLGEYAGGSSEFLDDALDLFYTLRDERHGFLRRPATAELLGWLLFLRSQGGNHEHPLRRQPELAVRTASCLIKHANDQDEAARVVEAWIEKRGWKS